MVNFFQQLSPEYRDLFTELMAVRDANGGLLATADEAATNLLKAFVTQYGKLDAQIATRLGGQPAYGRADVVLDLVRALAGPYPMPQAWLDAQRHGGFDLFAPEYYHARSAASRSMGSPGVYLQRMVAQYRSDANNRRASPANNVALYTETALLTSVIVVKTMQKAVCAKSALGPAWVVNTAVDPLSNETKRQMDALASNKAYIEALGEAIASVTAAHVTPDLAERTNDEVKHSLPASANVDAFFAEQDTHQLNKATDLLINAIECRSATASRNSGSEPIDKVVDKIIAAVDRMSSDKPEVLAKRVADATSYLDQQVVLTGNDKNDHYKKIKFLMPDLCSKLSDYERISKIILTSNRFIAADDMGTTYISGEKRFNTLFKAIISRINAYALTVGPPPLNTPLDHIPFFEAAANVGYLMNLRCFEALEIWRSAGLIPCEDSPSYNVNELVLDAMNKGVDSIDEMKIKNIIKKQM